MDRLGKYDVRGVLGRGAMGTVYEGWDPRIARRVAIKTVRLPDSADSEEKELLNRFQQEAQAAGRLQHPNIVGVFDYAETDELAYIVMEFVDGKTLKSILDSGHRPDPAEIGRLMDGLLTGLGYSHGHQVIHRDIKPANVIVTPDGVVKIADFGIARIGGSGMTLAGTIMGTPAYMSPEQFRGTDIDARSDIYSAGVVLFQLLTGKRPFEGSMATIMQAVLNQQTPLPSSLAGDVPPGLDAIVAKAIARAPDERFQTAQAFNRALQAALLDRPAAGAGRGDDPFGDATIIQGSGPGPAAVPRDRPAPPARDGRASPAPRPAGRSALPLVLAGVVVLLLAGGGAGWFLLGGPAPASAPAPGRPVITADNIPRARPVEETPADPAAASAAPMAPAPAGPAPAPAAPVQSTAVPQPAAPSPAAPASPGPSVAPSGTVLQGSGAGSPGPSGMGVPPPAAPAPASRPTAVPVNPAATNPGATNPGATSPAATNQAATNPVSAVPAAPVPALPVAPPLPPRQEQAFNEAPPQSVPAVPRIAPPVLAPVIPPVAPPVIPPPAPPPLPVPLAVPLPGGSIVAALRAVPCTAVTATERPGGTLSLGGAAGRGVAERTLRDTVRNAAPAAPLDWQVADVQGPYCGLLDLLRPAMRPFNATAPGLTIATTDGRTDLRENDLVVARATMPDYAAHLQLDYVSSDGGVLHMRQSAGPAYAAGATPVFGQKDARFQGWEIGCPFGTDLVVGLASSAPLFRAPRPEQETVDAYLKDLRVEVERVTRSGARVAAAVLVLRTTPLPAGAGAPSGAPCSPSAN